MKVKCIKTSFADDQEVALRCPAEIKNKQHISLGKHYVVYAIECSNDDLVKYLIQEDTYRPRLYPANLFEVIDSQLPYEEWHFGKYQNPVAINGIVTYFYVFGSKEMATDYNLFMSIIEQDQEGLFHFEEWRKLIDQQYESPY